MKEEPRKAGEDGYARDEGPHLAEVPVRRTRMEEHRPGLQPVQRTEGLTFSGRGLNGTPDKAEAPEDYERFHNGFRSRKHGPSGITADAWSTAETRTRWRIEEYP